MSGKTFLDTNIFIYCFDSKATHKSQIANLIVRNALKTHSAVISFQVVQEFLNVALSRFKIPFTPAEAEQYLTTVMQPLSAVHSSPALYSSALQLKSRYLLSWYDSLIVAAAAESGCTTLLTEDLQHGMQISGLRIQNPFLAKQSRNESSPTITKPQQR